MDLDVRQIPPTRKHAMIFDAFRTLTVGGAFVLINDHDPVPLRHQFDINFARSFTWDYEQSGPQVWAIRITKVASSPLPQILGNTNALASSSTEPDITGAIWKIPVADRDLDSNVILLPPGKQIGSHTGPDLDVVFVILAGSGRLTTEIDDLDLTPGDLVWLPKYSVREITAGPEGLRYLTVHTHKTGLQIAPAERL